MEVNEIRLQMESLWKETFGDSSDYIRLVFDEYFNPELLAYKEEGGEVVSALMGVPYRFSSASGKTLRGLYLCGLATKQKMRRKGMMSALLEEINDRAKEEEFDFTFLIPSGEGIRRYYADRGYHDAFYKLKEHYVRGHHFSAAQNVRVEPYVPETEKAVVEFLMKTEGNRIKSKDAYYLKHSERDWKAVLHEAEISRLPVFTAIVEDKVRAVAFAELKKVEVEIKQLIGEDSGVALGLLAGVENLFPEKNVTLVRNLEAVVEDENIPLQVWTPFFASNNPQTAEYEDIGELTQPFDPSRNAFPYGMVRILDPEKLLEKLGGENSESLKGFSMQQIVKLILRRPVGHNADALEKILNLPELSLSASLLLD